MFMSNETEFKVVLLYSFVFINALNAFIRYIRYPFLSALSLAIMYFRILRIEK